jgi:CO/xanthine dehydrogenase FAD-binding subunit
LKPYPFTYFSPNSPGEALELKARYGNDALCLAGGQSLVASLNYHCLEPAVLIDLNNLPELDYVRREADGTIKIGAMTRQRTLEFDPTIEKWLPLMHVAIPYIAHTAIRNRGTIGGSLSYADPAAELPSITIALDARFKAASTGGERWIAAGDFFIDMFRNSLKPEEILVEIEIPAGEQGSTWGYIEISRRHGDRVMMGVAAMTELGADGKCRKARLAYLNAARTPIDARRTAQLLIGESLTPAVIEAAASQAGKEVNPTGDVHTSIAYQRHLAEELTRRTLRQAKERAIAKSN